MDNTTPRALGFPLPEIHAIDASVFADGRYLCTRCGRMVSATAWAKPCLGRQPVAFNDLFPEPGVVDGVRGRAIAPATERAIDAPSHEENAR